LVPLTSQSSQHSISQHARSLLHLTMQKSTCFKRVMQPHLILSSQHSISQHHYLPAAV
jgi:hypothetical protein